MRRVLLSGVLSTRVDAARVDSGVIGRLVELLTGLEKELKAEQQKDKTATAGEAANCENNMVRLNAAIQETADKIDEEEAKETAETARADAALQGVEKEASDIEELQTSHAGEVDALKEATTKFKASEQKLTDDINGAVEAKKVLEGNMAAAAAAAGSSATLIQTGDQARAHVMDKIMTSTTIPAQQKLLIQLLASQQPGPPQAQTASFDSSLKPIITMVDDLMSEIEGQRHTLRTDFAKRRGNLQKKIQSLKNQIENANKRHTDYLKEKGRAADQAGKHNVNVTQNKALHSDHTKNLSDTTANCKRTAAEAQRRQTERTKEIDAVGQAKAILSGQKPTTKFIQSTAETVFIQLGHTTTTLKRSGNSEGDVRKVIDFVHQNGIELHAKQLQLLALNMSEAVKEVSGSPFDKIMKMIEGMISDVKKIMREQTKKNGECTRLYAEYKRDKEGAETALAEANLNIEDAVANLAELRAEQKERDEEEKAALAAIAAATKQRAEEKQEAEETIKTLQEEVSTMTEAIAALENYYNEATEQANTAGGKILEMIHSVVHETEELIGTTQNDESQAQKTFDASMQEEKVASAQRKSSGNYNREAVASAEKQRSENDELKREMEASLARLADNKIVIDVERKCQANAGKSLKDLHEEAMAEFKSQKSTLEQALEMLKSHTQ